MDIILYPALLTILCIPLVFAETKNDTQEQLSELLDSLLDKYDSKIRPGFGGEPTKIFTNIQIRSMGPISEKKMDYSMQCYFRQSWMDTRLQFSFPNITEVTLSQQILKKIWSPNTYFLNGKKSRQHNITLPNFFIRIRDDGRIYLSRRLTIEARCPMQLQKYPMDAPACPLFIGSYGFTANDIVYEWTGTTDQSVKVSDGLKMAQFDLVGIQARNGTHSTREGKVSVLEVFFHYKRHLGYYVLNIYLPCYLTVALSWVSFWINRDATPARVLLGVTTVLSTATIGITVRVGLPQVSYATALDIFFIMCFFYVFASLVQYSGVHFYTKLPAKDAKKDEKLEEENAMVVKNNDQYGRENDMLLSDGQGRMTNTIVDVENQKYRDSCWTSVWYCLSGNVGHRIRRFQTDPLAGNSVSEIDKLSRILFPLSFAFLNVIYWIVYLRDS
ncbi:gamma-aminobutyric acid receptor subunit alpha-2-like [Liolophura sinensis]|uniref:gamma-aminobutyric acid receptor subunit alpha-2-like n=1 Tax=Liolophura sinensis TaxID=3198878 RepID=UPI003159484A